MADGNLPSSGHVRDNIVLFKGVALNDWIDDGTTQAIESARVREATEPTQAARGPGCRGEPAGDWVAVTMRILRDSPTANFLRDEVGGTDGRFSYTPRGLRPGVATSRWFTNCAYVEGGAAGPNSGGDKFEEFIMYVYAPIRRSLNIVTAATAAATAAAVAP